MKKLTLILGLLIPSMLYSQDVIKVVKEYALINTDNGLGQSGDTIILFRTVGVGEKEVGHVKIIKFKNGKTACRIIKGKIKVGDHLKKQDDFNIDDSFTVEEQRNSNHSSNSKSNVRKLKFGFSGSIFIPSGDMADAYSTSFSIGALITLPIRQNYDMVFELMYPFLKINSEYQEILDYSGIDVNVSLLMILAYDRYKLDERSYLDAGVGIYFPSISASGYGESESVSKTAFGICVGPSIFFTRPNDGISIYGKFHTYSIEGQWVRFFTVGLQLII